MVLIGGHILVHLLPSAIAYLALIPARYGLISKTMTIGFNFDNIILIGLIFVITLVIESWDEQLVSHIAKAHYIM